MVDILTHKLVPLHEILPAKRADEVLKELHATKEQLPLILDSDPVIKAIKAKPGDVIRITRDSRTAKKTEYYRLVSED